MEQEAAVMEKGINDFVQSLQVGKPDTYRNLTVFPLYSGKSYENGYALLDEAITTGKFIVEEVSEGGSVPDLFVKNLLPDTDVLILQGEQVIGAKQNRIVNTSIIVPRAVSVKIPVSCCEQNRWSYRSRNFSSSRSPLYASLRKSSSEAVFKNLRMKKTFENDQNKVWSSIREKAARMKTSSETNAMEDIYETYENDMAAYETAFKAHPEQKGFISAIDGKIVGCDVFGDRDILPKVLNKLLRGYILDAIDTDRARPEEKSAKTSSFRGTSRAEKFLSRTLTAKKENFKSVGEGSEIRFEDKGANGFALIRNNSVVHMAVFA